MQFSESFLDRAGEGRPKSERRERASGVESTTSRDTGQPEKQASEQTGVLCFDLALKVGVRYDSVTHICFLLISQRSSYYVLTSVNIAKTQERQTRQSLEAVTC